MRTSAILIALALLGLAAPEGLAQRGSRGSSSGQSASGSRGSSSSASNQGSRGSTPRPSSSSSSRPSVSPSRPSTGGIRPSAPPSIRPGTGSTVRPSTSPSIRPGTGSSLDSSRGSTSGLPGYSRPGASLAPSGRGETSSNGSLSGSQIYADRGRTLGGTHQPDSAPTAGPAYGTPGAGADAGESSGLLPSFQSRSRVRFPAPYSHSSALGSGSTGSTSSGSASGSSGLGSRPYGSAGLSGRGPSTTTGSVDVSNGRRNDRALVDYTRGPTQRSVPPRPIGPLAGSPGHHGASSGALADSRTSTAKPELNSKSLAWRDVRRASPAASDRIRTATRLAGRVHELGVDVAVGVIGGVRPGGFRGNTGHDSWACDPWGWRGSFCHVGWSSWCGWSFPWYWSLYYPCWWYCSRPYYYADYAFYRPITTVVYAQPEVVYVNGSSAPVGETAVGVQQAPLKGSVAASPLSIAAQRYLELGDRAFHEGRYTDAVQFYAKAVEFAPDQGGLYLVLSDALFAAGDYHYCAYAIRRALELDPGLVETRVDKHGFYPDPQHFDAQLETLELYLVSHSVDRDARLVLALNYLFGARPLDAMRTIEAQSAAMSSDEAAQRVLEQARSLTH